MRASLPAYPLARPPTGRPASLQACPNLVLTHALALQAAHRVHCHSQALLPSQAEQAVVALAC
jgi:hypothetical protein